MLSLLCIGGALLAAQGVRAHGGVMIQTGTLENYEYLVQIYPYPPQVGVGVLSLFMFDFAANKPATEFNGEVYLAPPGSSEPCCQPGVHRGPYQLYTDPVMYPGDNTTYVPLDAPGPDTYRRSIYHQSPRAVRVDLLGDFDCPDNAVAAPQNVSPCRKQITC